MALRGRKTLRLGPFRWHWTLNGPSSWSMKFFAWSWNSKARRHRIDLPGGLHWVEDKPSRRPVQSTRGQGRKRAR